MQNGIHKQTGLAPEANCDAVAIVVGAPAIRGATGAPRTPIQNITKRIVARGRPAPCVRLGGGNRDRVETRRPGTDRARRNNTFIRSAITQS